MTDRAYEYRIANDGRTIQVRLKYTGRGRYPAWGEYLLCDSEDEAERILFLLEHPETTGMVRP